MVVSIQDELKVVTNKYYILKMNSKELQETHLERLASAIASNGNLHKQNVLKQLRHRESQRATAKKIKFIRGKLDRNSTIIVTKTLPDGTSIDITDKREMEKAIISGNKKKFKQSFSTPSYNYPYNTIFGYLGLTRASKQVLEGN
jgi:predicted phosphodiesterase